MGAGNLIFFVHLLIYMGALAVTICFSICDFKYNFFNFPFLLLKAKAKTKVSDMNTLEDSLYVLY